MSRLLGEYSGRTYQKPTVIELMTKHPMTTSHALRPPSGKSSSSSIVGAAVTWRAASVPRPFWLGFSSAGNITGGEGVEEEDIENLSQGVHHEVVNETIISRKKVWLVYTFHQRWWEMLVPYEVHYTHLCMYKVCKSQMRRQSFPRAQRKASENVSAAAINERESTDCDVRRPGLLYTSCE